MSRFALTDPECWSLLGRVREVTLAAAIDGRPLIRTMHPAIVDGGIVFHGGPQGEKAGWAGGRVAIAAEEVVARIPSHWRHPERACPATTWFRSVHVEGVAAMVEDPHERARALQALMASLQPEGGYRPLSADDPLYAKTIAGLGIWRVEPHRMTGRAKLGQHLNRPAMERVLQGLWRRGGPGDLEAIEACRAAYPEPVGFVDLPAGWRARCAPDDDDVRTAVALVRDAYWNPGFDDETLAEAVRAGPWVGIEVDGELVASARAITDRRKRGGIYDVMVRPDHRGKGLGKAVVALILDHPQVRDVAVLQLVTRDAMGLYARYGFAPTLRRGEGSGARTVMVRDRRAA